MLRSGVIVALILLALLPVAVWWILHRPLPPLDGVAAVPGLNRPVVVKFDVQGIPYIKAANDADVYEAQGYITARDRIFQMDMLRRAATGQLADVFGMSALPGDRLIRSVGIKKIAESEYDLLEPQVRAALDGYTRGVNAYISEYFDRLPLEFMLLGYKPKPWNASDSLAILKYHAYQLDESWRLDDLRQRVEDKVGKKVASELFRDDYSQFELPKVKGSKDSVEPSPSADTTSSRASDSPLLKALNQIRPFFGTPFPSWGSTAWAVPGSITESKGAILGLDKHSGYTMPTDWYFCSLQGVGIHVVGATIPGVPGIMHGRNDAIAWCSSSLKADVQDIYLEQFKGQFDKEFKTPSGWEEAGLVTELIPVRFGRDVEHKVLTTRHGPILIRAGDTGIALAWQGADPSKPSLNALYKLNRVHDWQEFVAALSDFSDPPQIFLYGDISGNVGTRAAGVIPVRTGGAQGDRLCLGWEKKNDWTSTIPFEKLPEATLAVDAVTLPQRGFVAANQKLSANKPAPKLASALMIGHQWNAPYRANRVLSVLYDREPSLQLATDLEGDQMATLAGLVKKEVRDAILQLQIIDRTQLAAAEMLTRWDNQLTPQSPQALIYESFLGTLARRLVEPKIGNELTNEYLERWPLWITLAERYLREKPANWLPPEERTHESFIISTLTQATKGPKVAFGPDLTKWSWQSAHQAVFVHPVSKAIPWLSWLFDVGPVGVGGDANTLNTNDVAFHVQSLFFPAQSGSTQRMLIDLSDSHKFFQVTAIGQSAHLFSPLRNDQLKKWLDVDLFPVAFSEQQLNKQAQHQLVLSNETSR